MGPLARKQTLPGLNPNHMTPRESPESAYLIAGSREPTKRLKRTRIWYVFPMACSVTEEGGGSLFLGLGFQTLGRLGLSSILLFATPTWEISKI